MEPNFTFRRDETTKNLPEPQNNFDLTRPFMTDTNQKKLGSTLWAIADPLRGAMDADDFRDIMLFRSAESKRIIFVTSPT